MQKQLKVIFYQWPKLHLGLDALSNQISWMVSILQSLANISAILSEKHLDVQTLISEWPSIRTAKSKCDMYESMSNIT